MSESSTKPGNRGAAQNLMSGNRLARNTIWNFTGQALPLLVGIAAIPVLIERLGTSRFGILTLVWMVIGYFGLFDFGLGRALTKMVAEKLGASREDEVPCLVWVALLMMGVLGVFGALSLGLLSPWIAGQLLAIEPELQQEAATAFMVLAVTVPIVIMSTALRGVLEAYQRFDLVVKVRIPSGVWTFLGPVAATLVATDLVLAVLVLAVGRAVAFTAYLLICLGNVQRLLHPDFGEWKSVVRSLLSFGGWMTVSNVIGPLMVRLDRLVIGATMTMAAVAYYATPYEFITRLWIIPSAIVGVLFPAFSSALVRDRLHASELFERSTRYLFLAVFPLALTVVALAPEGLRLWLGNEFAVESTPVLRWLAFGVWINCLAHVPFALIQADGRPDITAKLHLFEAPVYLVSLWLLLGAYGITGAAIAWTLRVVADTAMLYILALRRIDALRPAVWRRVGGVLAGSAFLGFMSMISSTSSRVLLLSIALAVFGTLTWTRLLYSDERRHILVRLRLVG